MIPLALLFGGFGVWLVEYSFHLNHSINEAAADIEFVESCYWLDAVKAVA